MDRNVYALGFFDAIHIGHRQLLSEGAHLADKYGAKLKVVTFGDGIYESLGLSVKEIYLLRERADILRSLGAEAVVLPCSREFLDKSAEEFLEELTALNPSAIVAGRDYRFGKNAMGDVDFLEAYLKNKDIEIKICDLVLNSGTKISTSRIRGLLSEGNIIESNRLLGAPFFITGTVVGGFKNGRRIGIPTANVDFERYKFVPKNGVYVTKTYVNGKSFPSVSNVGCHPTFNDGHVNLETHILDFSQEIYGQNIKVEFFEFIRGVKSFRNAEELKNQINTDIDRVKTEFNL